MLLFTLFISTTLAATAAETRQCVIDCARAEFGKPYVLGTEGPDTFDCSGLVEWCYEHCGYYFSFRPHTYELIDMGKSVKESELILADLVFPSSGHVQLYSGNGKIIHAPHSGSHVKEQSMYGFWAGRRLIGVDKDEYTPSEGGNTGQKSAKRVTITASSLNVRSEPSVSAESVAKYSKGETAPFDSYVRAEDIDWLSYIAGSGKRRYIASRTSGGKCYTTPCAVGGKGKGKLTARMTVRSLASASSSALGYLDEGTEINYDIVFTNGDYTWVSWIENETRKYVAAKKKDGKEYISPCP